jgi:biotin carboxyl carrier protein
MQLTFQYGDDLILLDVSAEENGLRARLPDGTEHRLTVQRLPTDILQMAEENTDGEGIHVFRVPFARTERGIEFSHGGNTFVFTPTTTRQTNRPRARASGLLTAPMVGMVVEVKVQEGQTVEAYQPLVVLEAMKVMAMLEAPFAGTVKKVYVQANQRVGHGESLLEIVPLA